MNHLAEPLGIRETSPVTDSGKLFIPSFCNESFVLRCVLTVLTRLSIDAYRKMIN